MVTGKGVARAGERGKMAAADAEYKILLLGDPGVGKTTWFLQVRQGEFVDTENPAVSMGIDHLEHKTTVQGKEVKVSVGPSQYLACVSVAGEWN